MKDSFTTARHLRNYRLPDTGRVAVIDMDDFFLTGDSIDVSRVIASAFEPSLSAIIRHAVFFLLDSQYVVTTTAPHAFKCTRGGGIGLLHSGHVTNAFFFLAVESKLELPPLWCRYHDDIVAGFDSRDQMYGS